MSFWRNLRCYRILRVFDYLSFGAKNGVFSQQLQQPSQLLEGNRGEGSMARGGLQICRKHTAFVGCMRQWASLSEQRQIPILVTESEAILFCH